MAGIVFPEFPAGEVNWFGPFVPNFYPFMGARGGSPDFIDNYVIIRAKSGGRNKKARAKSENSYKKKRLLHTLLMYRNKIKFT